MKKLQIIFNYLLLSFFLLINIFLPIKKSFAQNSLAESWGINELADGEVALGARDMTESIAITINIILGFLGTLTTIIILLGGFKWMTSQGNSEKVDEAKKMISSGVVGLVIILSAYTISRFVLEQLFRATTWTPY